MPEIECKEKGCQGKINISSPVSLKVGCGMGGFYRPAYPCDSCGLLYFDNGSPAVDGAGNRAFLINGNVVEKPAKGG